MVQWYHLPTVLAVHGDRRRLGEKPSQHHDVKSRGGGGGGGSKGMKKSEPIKLPEMEYVCQRHAGRAPTAETRNYMKPTASSDARKERSRSPVSIIGSPNSNYRGDNGSTSPAARTSNSKSARVLAKNLSFKPATEKSFSPVYDARRATCSSTLKECKFPAYLALNNGGTQSEGTAAVRVCPYTYCSLNSYHHALPPPLKSFLSARRAQSRTNTNRKLGMPDDFRSMRIEKDTDFFVEILSKKVEGNDKYGEMVFNNPNFHGDGGNESVANSVLETGLKLESDASGMDLETGYPPATLSLGYEHDEFPPGIETRCSSKNEGRFSNNEKSNFVGVSFTDGMLEKSGFSSDGDSSGSVQSLVITETSAPVDVLVEEPEQVYANTSCHNAAEEEAPFDNLGNELPIAVIPVQTQDIKDITQARTTTKGKKNEQEGDELGAFNPRGPNFLPLEPDPEAEKVDLRHQEVDEKRDAEEWMVDYALRRAVTKLGPARKRKVALLVEAFEEVMPATKCEQPFEHSSSAFDHGRPIQACR